MPSLSRITATFFTSLITRLGVRPPPPDAFELSNVVTPVTIVDADVVLNAQVTSQLLGTPYTAGELLNSAAGTVLADTGALPAGNYNFLIMIGQDNSGAGAVTDFRITRRNAANGADVWGQVGLLGQASDGLKVISLYATLLLNERIRVTTKTVNTTGCQANIWAVLVS